MSTVPLGGPPDPTHSQCFLLERFLHDLLFECDSPSVITDYLGVANDDQMGAGPDAGLRNGARKRSKRPPKVSRAVPASHLDMDGDTSVDINGDTGLDDHPAFYGGGIVTTEGKGAIVLQTLRERDLSHDSVLEDAAFMKTQIKFAG